MRRTIVFTIVFLISSGSLLSQRYGFRQYNVKQGLTHSQVRALEQDSDGYIWIGTLGGLSKFDGRNFETYGPLREFTFDQVESLSELGDNKIAAGSVGAFSILTEEGNTVYHLNPKFSKSAIRLIRLGPEKKLWLGTTSGLFEMQFEDSLIVPDNVRLKGDIRDLQFLDDRLYILTENALIQQKQNETDTLYFAQGGNFCGMIINSQDQWIASNGMGLIHLQNEKTEVLDLEDGLISSRLLNITMDNQGSIYCGSRLGFTRVKNGKFKNFSTANGLPYGEIRSLLIDDEDQLWLGTDGGGIIRFLGQEFTQYTTDDGLSSNLVMTISEDGENNLWVGTYDNGISTLNGTEKADDYNARLIDNKVWTSLFDSRGNLWFGTSSGITIFTDEESINLEEADGLPGNKILSLFEDANGTIWAGGSGVCKIDEAFQPSTLSNFPGGKVRDIVQSDSGEMWFATSKGLVKIDEYGLDAFKESSGLQSSSLSSLCFDDENNLWVGSKKGLHFFKEDSLVHISLGESYSSNFINFLHPLNSGILAGTNNGLFLVSNSPNSTETRVIQYNLDDGLSSLETNINAVHQDSQGNIWFGTAGGLMLHEGSFGLHDAEKSAPSIHFTELRLNLNPTNWEALGFAREENQALPERLELPYNKNHLTFYFNGIQHKYPDNIEYRYRLSPFDENWQPLTSNEYVTYTNIPDGHFKFEVQAIGKEGKWSEPISYSFTIHSPFWQTWWFIGLCVLFVVALVFYILHRRKLRLLEHLETERLEMKSKMLGLEQQSLNSSMNRHFIFNALNSIQYYINREDRLSANKYLSSFARLIRKNLDSSQQTFTSLSEELARLELYLQLENMRFQDKFDYEINLDPSLDTEEIQVPAMLLQPFLENSIWHGILPKNTKGKVTLDISSDGNGQILFKVSDDGIGIDTSKAGKKDSGSHISKGMDISQGRLNLFKSLTGQSVGMHGPTEIKDENGNIMGTELTIYLPKYWYLGN